MSVEKNEEDEPRRADVERLFAEGAAPLPEAVRARGAALSGRIAADTLAPSTIVGAYEVEGVLAQGGQATVYRARHRETKKWAALKVPRPDRAERLVREAQILFTLDHPQIVRIEAASVEGPIPYLALEYCSMGSLADVLRTTGKPLHLRVVHDMAIAVLEALDYAHGRGVVHRDVKPANILIGAGGVGEAKVADFGIGTLALAAGEDRPLIQTLASAGATLGAGTPLYMAPEQEAGCPVDARADLYALGKVIYEALTRHAPRTLRPVSRVRPDVPREWDDFIFKLVEEWPKDRFESAKAAIWVARRLPVDPARRPLETLDGPSLKEIRAEKIAERHLGFQRGFHAGALAERVVRVDQGADRVKPEAERREKIAKIGTRRQLAVLAAVICVAIGLGSYLFFYDRVLARETTSSLLATLVGLTAFFAMDGLFQLLSSLVKRRARPRASGGAGELPGGVAGPRGSKGRPWLGASAHAEVDLARLEEMLREAEKAFPALRGLSAKGAVKGAVYDPEVSRAIHTYVNDPARRGESAALLERLGLLLDVEKMRERPIED